MISYGPNKKRVDERSDLSCPAVSQSCRVTLVEPRLKVFIWKSIAGGATRFIDFL